MKPRKQSDATKLRHVRRTLAEEVLSRNEREKDIALLVDELKARRSIGSEASNVLFKIGQHDRGFSLTSDQYATMRYVQKRWDAIKKSKL